MKSRRSDHCLNCGFHMKDEEDFCPKCGQENRDKKVPLKLIINDFLGDYYTFDSKLFRSLIPLLFRPGFLTNEYNAGKRTRYIPPLRMYIFISILFFFIAGITQNENNDSDDTKKEENKITVGDTTDSADQQGLMLSMETGNLNVNVGDKNEMFTKGVLEGAVEDDKKLDEIFDSLQLEKTDFRKFLARIIISQTLKLKEQKESFSSYFMRNASLMMFFLMPLFAILLKLFYVRRKIFYIEHLIFSFHLHSFAFIILSVTEFFDDNLVDMVGLLLILVYLLTALRKVYLQSWFKTGFKFLVTLASYLVTLTFCMLVTMMITFLFF